MRIKSAIAGWVVVALFSSVAPAAAPCAQLRLQLMEMQKAQSTLLSAMVSKNDSMAMLFDNYAKDFESEDRKLKHADIENLHSSADAFRHHRERELQLIQKFSQRSSELINRTNECLAKAQPDLGPAQTSTLVSQ